MANIEQRAEAEAQHKGLSGGAARAYVGGVFNRIRQAHAKATTPGHGARHLKRAARKEARQEASNRNKRRKQLAAQERARLKTRTHSEEPRASKPIAPVAPQPKPAAMARPATPEPPAPEKKLSYREEQFRRKHQWKFEQGERDRARKAEQDARYQRNLELKQHGYQWKKVQDIGGPSDDGDNAGMVWQLYDANGKPVTEAEALRRIHQK